MAKAPIQGRSAFVDQLLAPLPEDVEQVQSKRYASDLRKDLKAAWRRSYLLMAEAQHHRSAAYLRTAYAFDFDRSALVAAEEDRRQAQQRYWNACDVLMRVPAPGVTQFRWKQGTRKFNGGSPDWEAAIAADAARLGIVDAPLNSARKPRQKREA